MISINPGEKDQILGYVSKANPAQAEKALQAALEAYESWKNVTAVERQEAMII